MASLTVMTDALVRVKSSLHRGGSMALPAALLFIGGGLLAYRRATSEDKYFHQDPLSTFIALIMVQMMPLVFLEVKILHHDDPVGIMYRFGTNVTFMHVLFLTIRAVIYSYTGTEGTIWPLWCLCLVLAAAVFVLVQGFKLSPDKKALFGRMRDVWLLVGLAVVTALLVESIGGASYVKRICRFHDADRYYTCLATRWWKNLDVLSFAFSTSNFTELLAFVPVCLQMGRELTQKKREDFDLSQRPGVSDPTWAVFFFIFLIVLYFIEDVGTSFLHITTQPVVTVAHGLHFLLVLDFSIFFLGEIYDPAKLKAHLMEWLPEALQCSALV